MVDWAIEVDYCVVDSVECVDRRIRAPSPRSLQPHEIGVGYTTAAKCIIDLELHHSNKIWASVSELQHGQG